MMEVLHKGQLKPVVF